jgi:septal ring factor EnvC (AmiA/AmiB activator)
VPEHLAEIAALRAVEAQYKKREARADRQRREQEVALRRELEVEKRLVHGLEADKRASEERIRELEAGAGVGQKRIRELEAGASGDEWTRMCDDKTV